MKDNKRKSAQAPFAGRRLKDFRGVSRTILLVVVFILMSLPLFTTFNEILTKIVETTGLYDWLTKWIVPFETRAVSLVLQPLGVNSKPTISHLFIERPDGSSTGIYFSWNCLGWQSGILLLLTLITGLSGPHKIFSKIETITLGISGTFLINLVRISTVVLVAYYFGQLPATIVHDYGGTLFTVLWFFFFWWFSYNFILEESDIRIKTKDS
jgi:exosortase/archaeosortase family protein